MAIKDVTIRLKMLAEGTQQQVENSERIANNYASANASAKALGATNARAAAVTGSRSPRETVEYGMARGAAGATGASGRDFANQAQGLGGLVRLYATYAANLFAVEAAFRALREAMNTENMIKGLDQLGAASGRALGALSKQLVDVTGGSISLREAMDAVAKSSSAGMSSQNILRMGEAAQKASQTLGVNMTDAISRISRGITKLEPELLDELGIFVRIDDASEKYARQLGKTAGSLTEFERRQAFANEVLTQAESKFGKIKIDPNPYDKLSASLSNLTQQGLTVVNTFLIPFVDALSKSPVALTTAIGALGAMIIKQAIPAITQYRQQLEKVRQSTLAAVSSNSKEFKLGQLASLQNAEKEARRRADISIEMADYAQLEIEKLAKSGALKDKKRVQELAEISKRSATEVTDQQLAYLERQSKKNMANNRELGLAYKNYAEALRVARDEEGNRIVNQNKATQAAKELQNIKQRTLDVDRKFIDLTKESALATAKASVADKTKNDGLIAGLRQAYAESKKLREGVTQRVGTGQFEIIDGKKVEKTAEIVTKKFGLIETAATGVGLGFSAIATKALQFGATLLRAGIIVGSIAVGLEILRGIFTNVKDEEEKFAKSSEILNASLKNVSNTLEYLQDLKPDKLFSIDSVQARATAFNDLSDSLAKNTLTVAELNKKTEGFLDITINGFKYLFGDIIGDGLERFGQGWEKSENLAISALGTITKYAGKLFTFISGGGTYINQYSKNLSDSIIKAVALSQGPAREQLKEVLNNVLGQDVDLSNAEAIRTKLDQISEVSFDKLISTGQQVSDIIARVSRDANNTASSLSALTESIKTLTKDVTDFNNRLLPSDGLGKIGVDLLDVNRKLFSVIKDNKQQLLGLKEVITNVQTLSLLPKNLVENIIGDRTSIIKTGEEIVKIQKEIEALEKTKAGSTNALERSKLSKAIENLRPQLAAAEAKASEFTRKYVQQISFGLFEAGVKKLDEGLKLAFQEAAVIAGRKLVSLVQAGGGRTADLEADLAKKELSIQQQLIDAQYQSKLATERLSNQMERKIAQDDIILKQGQLESGKIGSRKLTAQDKAALQREIDSLTETLAVEGIKAQILANPTKQAFEKLQKEATDRTGQGTGNLQAQRALVELGQVLAVQRGMQAQKSIIAAKQENVEIEKGIKSRKEEAAILDRRTDRFLRANNLQQQYLSSLQSALGISSAAILKEQEQLELSNVALTNDKEQRKIYGELYELGLARYELDQIQNKTADQKLAAEKNIKDIIEKTTELTQSQAIREQSLENIKFKYAMERLKLAEQIRKLERETYTEQLNNINQISSATIDYQMQILDYQMKLNDGDNRAFIISKQNLEVVKLNLDYQNQQLQLAEKQAQINDRSRLRSELLKRAGTTADDVAEFDRLTNLQQAALTNQVETSKVLFTIKQNTLKLTQEQALEEEKIRFLLQESQQLSAALAGAFGKFGERLGSASNTLVEIGTQIAKNAELELRQKTKIQEIEQSGDIVLAEDYEKLSSIQEKGRKDEIAGNAKVLASTKNLFKEKTTAYKLFNNLEKAYHVVRLAMAAKELTSMIANTIAFVTNSITRQTTAATEAGTLGVKAVINAMSTLPPPASFAAGAAMTAVVAGLLGQIGKSFRGGSKGPTTAQKEEAFGTAMGYDSGGNKVQVRQGVLGFPDEKANSISKGIENIERYTNDGLVYDNKILNTLKSINQGIDSLTIGIFKAQGITDGRMAGNIGTSNLSTQLFNAGTTGLGALGGYLLGSTAMAESLVGFVGNLIFDGLGTLLSGFAGPLGLLAGAIVGKIFSYDTKARIDESGIRIKGTFEDLADKTEEGVTGYIKGVIKAESWFDKKTVGNINDTISLANTEGGRSVIDAIQGVFRDSKDLFFELAGSAGKDIETIRSQLANIKPIELDINLKDMDAKAAAEKINVAVSALLDDAAQALFSEFKQFIKSGENLLDATIRTVTQQQVVQAQLRATAMNANLITKDIEGIRLADTITQAFGGLDAFSDSMSYFRQNFLTEAERLKPAQEMLVERLKQLGYESVDTIDEFKQLVLSIDPVDKASATLLKNLLAIAPAMQAVFGPDSVVTKLLFDINTQIAELEDSSTDLEKAIGSISKKASEYVETLYQANQATAENIEVIARWTKLATLKEIRAQLKTTFEDRKRELESSISALEKVKTSLVDFKNQLLQGDLSPLSDLDKFSQLRSEYDKLLQDVRSSDSAVANAAAEKFPVLSQQLLTTASTLYGSGELYQTLHKKILADLDTTTDIVNTKLTDAQQQLVILTAQGVTLGLIEQNTKTTAQKFEELLRLYNAVNAVDPAKVGQTAAASIQAGNTATSSLSNAFTEQIKASMPEILITPLELTPEAKAKKAAEEKAAADAAKAAADAAKAAADAAAAKAAADAAAIKAAIDQQTVVLAQVLTNTSGQVVDEIKTTNYISTGSFGKTQNLLAPMQER